MKFSFLWNRKINHLIHKSSPSGPIMSQFNPFHTSAPYFANINFNTNCIVTSTPGSSSTEVFRPKFYTYFSFPSCVSNSNLRICGILQRFASRNLLIGCSIPRFSLCPGERYFC